MKTVVKSIKHIHIINQYNKFPSGFVTVSCSDALGNLLPGGVGWMVPGSRVNHEETGPALIEVQVYHFSGAQAVVFAPSGDAKEEDRPSDSSNADIFITANCFINSLAQGPSRGSVEWIGWIGFFVFLLHFKHRRCEC